MDLPGKPNIPGLSSFPYASTTIDIVKMVGQLATPTPITPGSGDGPNPNRHCTAWEQINPAINIICDLLELLFGIITDAEIPDNGSTNGGSAASVKTLSYDEGNSSSSGESGSGGYDLEKIKKKIAEIRGLAAMSIMSKTRGE